MKLYQAAKIQERVALEFGYESDVIKQVLYEKSFPSSGELVDYLFQLNVEEIENYQQSYCKRLEKAEMEKQRLKNDKLKSLREDTKVWYLMSKCMNCFSNERNIVILPCSHLSLCEYCSKKVYFCPVCQEKIACTIKTFQS